MSPQTYSRLELILLLGVLFPVLRLFGAIDWSWWLVLLPLYLPLATIGCLFVVIMVAIFVFGGGRAK